MVDSRRSARSWCWAAFVLLVTSLASAEEPPGRSSDRKGVGETTIRPGELWNDINGVPINAHGGGILAHGGRFYWFGEEWGQGWERNGVRVYASSDLANWEDLGRALEMSDEPGHPLERGSATERPKVLYCRKTGRFVMWFHHELKGRGYGAAHAAVALADRVDGPYQLVHTGRPVPGAWPMNLQLTGPAAATRPSRGDSVGLPPDVLVETFELDDPRYHRIVHGYTHGQESRDMTVFQDEDGTAYLIYSSEMNSTLHVAELTEDYLGYTGRFARIMIDRKREAPVLFKRDGRYYLITSACTGWKPNRAEVAVADSIWGPWKTLGNPWQGPEERTRVSFDSQGTFALQMPGNPDKVLFMADRWHPGRIRTSPYIWVPVEWDGQKPILRWRDEWDLQELFSD